MSLEESLRELDASIAEATSCAVLAPIVPGDETYDRCGRLLPCPDHGVAALRSLGFVDDETLQRLRSKPNIRLPEGPTMSISDAEPNTDIGAQPDDTQDAEVSDTEVRETPPRVQFSDTPPDSEATDADES